MNIIVAMDSFKGSLSSKKAGEAVRAGIKAAMADARVEVFEMADGGEGTVHAVSSRMTCEMISLKVTGPLGEPVDAVYAMTEDKTAILEVASACGLTLIPEEQRNPMNTTTLGVGELILDAYERGCRKFLIGLGGSGTNDCGIGMLSKLGFHFMDQEGKEVSVTGSGLSKITDFSIGEEFDWFKDCFFTIASDVKNPLCGDFGASAVFGPQKGLKEDEVKLMDRWMYDFANLVMRKVPTADPKLPGCGAAGGLGFAFRSFFPCEFHSGAELVLRMTGFQHSVKEADLVITGEGRLDGQTNMGKAPYVVAKLSKREGKPVCAFAGCIGEGAKLCKAAGIDEYYAITEEGADIRAAMRPEIAYENLRNAVRNYFLREIE